MRLSAPIYRLKRDAKRLARQKSIPLHEALDRIAAAEGFQSWSHLAAEAPEPQPAMSILKALDDGDVVLLGARPGHGKTLLGLELAAGAEKIGRTGYFFTLDYLEQDVDARFRDLGIERSAGAQAVKVDASDEISAGYIVERLKPVAGKALIVVDYLQLLDQQRTKPGLEDQVRTLKAFARASGAIVTMISQIDRTFDRSARAMPGLADVRLPNPLDLSLFDKACFLHEGEIRLEPVQP